jgi:hypothetical protein
MPQYRPANEQDLQAIETATICSVKPMQHGKHFYGVELTTRNLMGVVSNFVFYEDADHGFIAATDSILRCKR